MSEPVITVDSVSKRYVKFSDTPTLVGRALQLRNRTRRSELWALRDIDFAAKEGECIGVIGRNGSGKSTLLRLLAGVTAPTRGSVRVRGRVAPLIAVGVGFHPELTGRENVYLSSAILGTSRVETAKLFDSIVDFADIGEFIDTPVKFYSSGMYVRLGFSVAVAVHPEVLLVDEVLAVGDIGFQQRCFTRIEEIRRSGTTVVIVSHNLNAVNRLCDRTHVLHDGEFLYSGDTSTAISHFHGALAASNEHGEATSLRLEAARVIDESGTQTNYVNGHGALQVELDLVAVREVSDLVIGIQVVTEEGVMAYSSFSPWDATHEIAVGHNVRCQIGLDLRLTTGTYELRVAATDRAGNYLLPPSTVESVYVEGPPGSKGVADLGARFEVRTQPD